MTKTVVFMLMLFGDAQHPEIYSDSWQQNSYYFDLVILIKLTPVSPKI